jgi:hypothetical protein
VQQFHRITDAINTAMANQQYCTAAFLDVSQAFDKVWHPGLLFQNQKNFTLKLFQHAEIVPK